MASLLQRLTQTTFRHRRLVLVSWLIVIGLVVGLYVGIGSQLNCDFTMTFVPAVLALLGRRSWWLPAWLGRILPNVNIEGTNVRQGPAEDSGGSLRAA